MCFIFENVSLHSEGITNISFQIRPKAKHRLADIIRTFESFRTGESIDLTASWAETETSSSRRVGQ